MTYSGQEIAACETGIGGAAWGLMRRKGKEDEAREEREREEGERKEGKSLEVSRRTSPSRVVEVK